MCDEFQVWRAGRVEKSCVLRGRLVVMFFQSNVLMGMGGG